MPFNSSSRILITGGTGSFGKAFIAETLKCYPSIKRLVIYSRDELKQWELQQLYPERDFPQLRFFIGDVRDRDRLRRALERIDTVVHAAALKQVPAAEYNPIEFINTNVLGAENVVQACLDTGVRRVVDNQRYPAFVELRGRRYELLIQPAQPMSKSTPPHSPLA